MEINDIITLIDAIPQYIKLFYPGYITIYVYMFLRAKHISDTKGVILKSFALSYVYSIIIAKTNIRSELFLNFWLIIASTLVAYIAYRIAKSDFTLQVFRVMGIETTFDDNEIEALQNTDAGTWLTVYLSEDNLVYEGWLHLKEMEPGNRQYISLTSYRKYMLDSKGKPTEPYIENHDTEADEEVILFYENIKRIEKRHTN